MPQTIKKYRIFVASPSDVKEEREAIEEVIVELNSTYGNRLNLIFELIKWETHSAPAISKTQTQDIIDSDIGCDYDLFIGILWKRFGTPTSGFNSGTEQEFHKAYNRFKQSSTSLQILFYFKTSPPTSLHDINPLELERVNNFKNSLGEKSVLYWEYNAIEDLQKFLRIHIPKRIDELDKLQGNISQTSVIIHPIEQQVLETEELGIIDYQEISLDSFANCSEALHRITDATNWIGYEVSKKAAELNTLKSHNSEIGKKVVRDFYKRTAEMMNHYASRLQPEIPIYIDSFERGANAFANMVSLYRSDIKEPTTEENEDNLKAIVSLIAGIDNGLNGMRGFLESVSAMPRMSKELNQARSNLEKRLTDLLIKLEVSKSIATELFRSLL